jgi:hypothetical protein
MVKKGAVTLSRFVGDLLKCVFRYWFRLERLRGLAPFRDLQRGIIRAVHDFNAIHRTSASGLCPSLSIFAVDDFFRASTDNFFHEEMLDRVIDVLTDTPHGTSS